MTEAPRSLLIYDGDCGFCTSSANWFAKFLGADSIAPWQSLDLHALGLTADQVMTAAWWVDADGQLHRGHLGVAHALMSVGGIMGIAGRAISVPPLSWVAAPVYGLIAKNRYRMPGSTDACRLDS